MLVCKHAEPKKIKPDVTRPSEIVLDYWEPARKHLLGDPKLIQRLLEFDKDNVDAHVVEIIVSSFINNPLFNPEVIRKVDKLQDSPPMFAPTPNGDRPVPPARLPMLTAGVACFFSRQASLAAYGISCWVRALIEYDSVVKYVAPKRQRLAVAEAEFGALAQSLQEKRAELDRVQRKLTDLADKLRYLLSL